MTEQRESQTIIQDHRLREFLERELLVAVRLHDQATMILAMPKDDVDRLLEIVRLYARP